MKDWNTTVEPSNFMPRASSKNASPSGNSRGSMTTTPTRSSSYGASPMSSPESQSYGAMASLEKLSKMVSEFVMSNFSEVLEQERAKHEERYHLKIDEMAAMQELIDELNGKVDDLTNMVKRLEDDKSDLERDVHAKEKEITRLEAESDSMKAFMKQSLNL
ncbi:hypothetical protein ACHAXN_006832 [Cyclotella atomus]|jgi:septal ring factor EnvC (AmiA/AmiB activator)